MVCSILDVGRTDPITEHHYLKWFIYLTNWGMISCALQAWLGALIVTGGMMIVREEFSKFYLKILRTFRDKFLFSL